MTGQWHPLRWRHNGPDSVSNHQPHHCLLNCLFRHRSKKTSKLRVTGLCAGNSPGTGEFPAQMASNAENVSIWWRHHVSNGCHATWPITDRLIPPSLPCQFCTHRSVWWHFCVRLLYVRTAARDAMWTLESKTPSTTTQFAMAIMHWCVWFYQPATADYSLEQAHCSTWNLCVTDESHGFITSRKWVTLPWRLLLELSATVCPGSRFDINTPVLLV